MPAVNEDVMDVSITTLVPDFQLVDFKLPAPKDLTTDDERMSLVSTSISRIWDGADDLRALGEALSPDSVQAGGNSASEMWMLLLVRMVTRVAEPPPEMNGDDDSAVTDYYVHQDELRQKLCDYIMADFPQRYVFSTDVLHSF